MRSAGDRLGLAWDSMWCLRAWRGWLAWLTWIWRPAGTNLGNKLQVQITDRSTPIDGSLSDLDLELVSMNQATRAPGPSQQIVREAEITSVRPAGLLLCP